MVAHSTLGVCQSHQISLPSLCIGEGFSGFSIAGDMAHSQSVVGIKPGDSGMVIGYLVDKCAYT